MAKIIIQNLYKILSSSSSLNWAKIKNSLF